MAIRKASLLEAERRNSLSEQIQLELAENLTAYRTASAVADCSIYQLYPEEKYLFPKYYKIGESVLDLACGMGRTTLLLHEMGLAVRGVDRSDILIEKAKRRFPYLDLRVGSYDQIEEPDNSFTHVLISINGIDLALTGTQRVAALRECARVLKPGGTFIYSSHNLKSLHWFSPYYWQRLQWKVRNSFNAIKEWAYMEENGLHGIWTSRDFAVRQTEAAGLEFLEMKWIPKSGVDRVDRYLSPYIHYVFTKPCR